MLIYKRVIEHSRIQIDYLIFELNTFQKFRLTQQCELVYTICKKQKNANNLFFKFDGKQYQQL